MGWVNGKYLITMGISITIAVGPKIGAETDQRVDQRPASGHLSLGLGYGYIDGLLDGQESELGFFINGRYQWHGLFFEYANGPGRHKALPTLGYNFYTSQRWYFDAVYTWTDADWNFKGTFNNEYLDLSREQSENFGLRATGAYGSNFLQFAILPFSNEEYDNGLYASAWMGRDWQLRNWTLQAIAGAQYRSKEIMDYYFGVDEGQGGSVFPAYQAEAGVRYTLQLGASYPLSRHWVFESYLRHTEFSSSAKNSPMMRFVRDQLGHPDDEVEAGILINYVF